MVYDGGLLDEPMPQAHEHAAAVAQAQCLELLQRCRARAGLAGQVRDILVARLAEELLVTGGLSVAEVACRLGYVEVSSFSRAFRRWKGTGPRAYRTQLRRWAGVPVADDVRGTMCLRCCRRTPTDASMIAMREAA